MNITQSTTQKRKFLLVSNSDHITGLIGASPTVLISKSGESFAAALGTVTEIGYGWYEIELTVIDTNTPGILAYHVTAASADPTDFEDTVIAADAATTAALTFEADVSSYVTLASAQNYFDTRHVDRYWRYATVENRQRALISSTRAIDRLNFVGEKYDSDQALEFPRGTDTTVPEAISIACCENAYELLGGRDPHHDLENLGVQATSLGPVRTTYQRDNVPEHLAHGIVSATAWMYLRPYLRDARIITLSRTH